MLLCQYEKNFTYRSVMLSAIEGHAAPPSYLEIKLDSQRNNLWYTVGLLCRGCELSSIGSRLKRITWYKVINN